MGGCFAVTRKEVSQFACEKKEREATGETAWLSCERSSVKRVSLRRAFHRTKLFAAGENARGYGRTISDQKYNKRSRGKGVIGSSG